jgi:hypothetical protein
MPSEKKFPAQVQVAICPFYQSQFVRTERYSQGPSPQEGIAILQKCAPCKTKTMNAAVVLAPASSTPKGFAGVGNSGMAKKCAALGLPLPFRAPLLETVAMLCR